MRAAAGWSRSRVAGGGDVTIRSGALWPERYVCFARLRWAAVEGAGVVVVAPDTDHRHRFFEWCTGPWWVRKTFASEGDATTTPVESEAVQRRVRAMIRVMAAQAGPVGFIDGPEPLRSTPSG